MYKRQLLHIADATAQRIRADGLKKIALLGTRFTMQEEFYKGRLAHQYALDVITPDPVDMETVHRVIYDELCLGKIEPSSGQRYSDIIGRLVAAGAQGVILGCTEIGLLVKQRDYKIPLFDTTRIHAEAAVDFALKE